MNIDELKQSQEQLKSVNILSNEGDIYLVEALFDSGKQLLTDGSGKPKRFHSVFEVKESLQGLSNPQFRLVFDSPYEEI